MNPQFWQHAPEYHGAIASDGDWRLSVSSSGKRYLLQKRDADGVFVVKRWRKALSLLKPDIPPSLWCGVPALPDDPQDFPRPWADDLQTLASAGRAVAPSSDEYAGVLSRHGAARIAVSPKLNRYILQTSGLDGWETVAAFRSRTGVFDLVFSTLHASHKARAFSRVAAFMSLVVKLPERPVEFNGEPAKRLARAQAMQKSVRPDEKQTRPSGGPENGLSVQNGR